MQAFRREHGASSIVALVFGVSGCISSYRYPQPNAAPAVARDDRAAPSDGKLAVNLSVPRGHEQLFLNGLRGLGAEPVEAEQPPAEGRFVRVTVREVPDAPGERVWGMVAQTTGFILPAYSNSSGYDLSFDTFVDGQPVRHYAYETRATTWAWAGLLPVVWVNWLTPSHDDAFSGVVRQFLADSRNDGF